MPQTGAPCGLVDTLDFPVDPPDAQGVAFGGRDFGVFRSRFDGYHTGEDWRGGQGQSGFGAPVYSIGHGTVTYAAPLGWGADQGVLIVRHVFADGSTVLSFYGHLDPPSVVLRAGDCVARGDQVGQIGKPRTPPHLHFEIRTHMPNSPGPGYWSVDPTLAGWEPPSKFIWNNRIAGSPGIQWTRAFEVRDTRGIGMLGRDTFVAVEDNRLVGIDVEDGSLRWSHPITITVREAALDADRAVMYISNYVGEVSAFRLPDASDQDPAGNTEMVVEPLWEIDLDPIGLARLVPLPNGGVAASFRGQVVGVSPTGRVVWEHDTEWSVFDWVSVGDQLLFSTVGAEGLTWMVDEVGRITGVAPVGGNLAVAADRVWVYDQAGIYSLDPETLSSELLYALPWGSPRLGDMVALPDGGVLVAHSDRADRRLIVLSPEGRLRWQRSISNIVQGQVRLLLVGRSAHLVSQYDSVSGREVSVFSIDLEDAELTRIFTGGSRNPLLNETWVFAAGDGRILVNIADSGMAALDPHSALEVVRQAATAQ